MPAHLDIRATTTPSAAAATPAAAETRILQLWITDSFGVDSTGAAFEPFDDTRHRLVAHGGAELKTLLALLSSQGSQCCQELVFVSLGNDLCTYRSVVSRDAWMSLLPGLKKTCEDVITQAARVATGRVTIVYGGDGQLWGRRWRNQAAAIIAFNEYTQHLRGTFFQAAATHFPTRES